MKIYKGQFGWNIPAHSKNMDGSEVKSYVIAQFPKGREPMGDYLEGELIFKSVDGKEYNCFLSCYVSKDGSIKNKLVLMDEQRKAKQQPLTSDDNTDMFGGKSHIDQEELPFY